jgi:hypothetical protein
MIGVILWSDPDDRKAVIWCEDQGDLAFLDAPVENPEKDAFFDAGDVVQFDMNLECSFRRAHNPKLIVEKVGKGLPEALRSIAPAPMPPTATAEVIPFVARGAGPSSPPRKTPLASGG